MADFSHSFLCNPSLVDSSASKAHHLTKPMEWTEGKRILFPSCFTPWKSLYFKDWFQHFTGLWFQILFSKWIYTFNFFVRSMFNPGHDLKACFRPSVCFLSLLLGDIQFCKVHFSFPRLTFRISWLLDAEKKKIKHKQHQNLMVMHILVPGDLFIDWS